MKTQEERVKYLNVNAYVRYWEDAKINGESSEDGNLVPFKDGDNWTPQIDVDTGIILAWPKGVVADIHFKVCDRGTYELYSIDAELIAAIEDDYVPQIMCPGDNGYGDHIIMKIESNGKIENWRKDFSGFSLDMPF